MTAIKDQEIPMKGKALIVDDVLPNRKLLEVLLNQEGYHTILAEDGQQAVELYTELQPDIVFMDAMMPVMDGFQATMRIKQLAGGRFVPVIFLTALSESDALVKCIEAGGDDFMSKPFKREILAAKIKAMERIRDLTRLVEEQHHKIEIQHQILLKEQVLAQQIYSRAVTADNVASKFIKSMLQAVSVFSGDMLLTADCPDGKLHILLGDFTGHGLTASVGVLPAAEVFRAMTAKGFTAPEILDTINGKLNRLLPTGMFLAAVFVVIDKDMRSVTIWNAGMPEVLVLGETQHAGAKTVKARVISEHLPLGILKSMDDRQQPVRIDIAEGDRILLCSDGLSEANNAQDEAFGLMRYEHAALTNADSFSAVLAAVDDFREQRAYRDDMSFVEILCKPGLLRPVRSS